MNLQLAFADLWRDIGAVPDYFDSYADLINRHHEPHRKYHNTEYLADSLEEIAQLKKTKSIENPLALELAQWFKRSVYSTDSGRYLHNETESAVHAELTISNTPFKDNSLKIHLMKLVPSFVHCIKLSGSPFLTSLEEKCMADIDLSILGKSEERYDRYAKAIPEEFGLAGDYGFNKVRALFLENKLLAKPMIFHTPYFIEKYEDKARENIAREIRSLSQE